MCDLKTTDKCIDYDMSEEICLDSYSFGEVLIKL